MNKSLGMLLLQKANPNHDEKGRFSSVGGSINDRAASLPLTIYSTYRSGGRSGQRSFTSEKDVVSGIFGMTQRTIGGNPWKPNEYGDKVVRLQIDRKAKTFTAGDQGDAITELFPEDKRLLESWQNGEFSNPTKMRELDEKIANEARKQGYQLIHYNNGEYGDEWGVIDHSVIQHAAHEDEVHKINDGDLQKAIDLAIEGGISQEDVIANMCGVKGLLQFRLQKANPNHDEKGRFSSAGGGIGEKAAKMLNDPLLSWVNGDTDARHVAGMRQAIAAVFSNGISVWHGEKEQHLEDEPWLNMYQKQVGWKVHQEKMEAAVKKQYAFTQQQLKKDFPGRKTLHLYRGTYTYDAKTPAYNLDGDTLQSWSTSKEGVYNAWISQGYEEHNVIVDEKDVPFEDIFAYGGSAQQLERMPDEQEVIVINRSPRISKMMATLAILSKMNVHHDEKGRFTFFTSDQHFGSSSKAKQRGFATKKEMNKKLIKEWNKVVRPKDLVYVVGDFGKPKYAAKLHGEKILVRGNHDKLTPNYYKRMGFKDVVDETTHEDWRVVHTPGKRTDEKTLSGHHHVESVGIWARKDKAVNVGVDFHGFKPVTLKQIKEKNPDLFSGKIKKTIAWLPLISKMNDSHAIFVIDNA